jgi:predicted MPP superfamily phosphohydrolase
MLEVPVPRLAPGLDGLRILHLSDLHLGTFSLAGRTLDAALDWAEELDPDLVAITGDLVTRDRGRAPLEAALGRLRPRLGTFLTLGNHDVDDSRDPFRRPADLSDLSVTGASLLHDQEVTVTSSGLRIQVVGVDPNTYVIGKSRPVERADRTADLRILLCHFPEIMRRLPAGVFHLVLAGHYHGGQICLPTPWGRLPLKEFRAPYLHGLYPMDSGVLHVSRGLGTSFVPLRLLARPEATLLTLRAEDA